jgi:hypothetical protein
MKNSSLGYYFAALINTILFSVIYIGHESQTDMHGVRKVVLEIGTILHLHPPCAAVAKAPARRVIQQGELSHKAKRVPFDSGSLRLSN